MSEEQRRRFGFPAEPTADKHKQRIEANPSPLLMAGAAVMTAMIVGLVIFGLWELGR